MDAPKKISVGVGRIRHALGDGATEEQALRVRDLLRSAGILSGIMVAEPLSVAPDVERAPDRYIAPGDLVGVAEIAAVVGVSSSAIVQRKDLPEPLVRLKQGRIWERSVIEDYLRLRGEL